MKRNGPHGFSLIELLVVLAIIAVLAAASITAFTNIASGRSLAKAAGDLAGILELSRSYAMANNSAARVALNLTNAPNGEPRLIVEVFEQRPGETNSKALQRKRTFENITANITATTEPSNITNFRFNSRGELQLTNSTPLQSLDIKLGTAGASNNATVTILGLTGTVSVSQP